jgi:hypothetical protein
MAAAWEDETGALMGTSGAGDDALRRLLSEAVVRSSGGTVVAGRAAVAVLLLTDWWSACVSIDNESIIGDQYKERRKTVKCAGFAGHSIRGDNPLPQKDLTAENTKNAAKKTSDGKIWRQKKGEEKQEAGGIN